METLVGVSIHSEGTKTGSAASGTHELLMVSDPPASQGPSTTTNVEPGAGRLPGVQMVFGGVFFTLVAAKKYISGGRASAAGPRAFRGYRMLTTNRACGMPD